MKKIVIITSDSFPRGNAGATRQEALARLFCMQGNTVDVIGMGQTTSFKFINLNDDIRYISLKGKKKDLIHRVYDRVIFGHRMKKILCKSQIYDIVLIESIPKLAIKSVKKYRKKTKCLLIHDSVEWYSPSEFKYGRFNWAYIMKNNLNTRYITNDFNVIAISSFLENFYMNKGCKVVRIPFIHDVKSLEYVEKKNTDKIIFMYAGMMGRKDYLGEFLNAVNLLNVHQKSRIIIHLFGFNVDYLLKTNSVKEEVLQSLKENIHFHGRVTREVVESNLKNAHFTLLFRNNNERYAKAGFPTKVVESLMFSTPVLCNLSSDLGFYLKDSYNSIISTSYKTEDIIISLKRILVLTKDELNELQLNARKSALRYFDYRLYNKEINYICNNQS